MPARLEDFVNVTGSSSVGQTARPGIESVLHQRSRIDLGRPTPKGKTAIQGPPAPGQTTVPRTPIEQAAGSRATPRVTNFAPVGVGLGQIPDLFTGALRDTEALFERASAELAEREARDQQVLGALPGRYAQETNATRQGMNQAADAAAEAQSGFGPGGSFGDETQLLPIIQGAFDQATRSQLATQQGIVPVLQAGGRNAAAERVAALESSRMNELNAIRSQQAQMQAQLAIENARLQAEAALQAQRLNAERLLSGKDGLSFGTFEVSADRGPLLTPGRRARAAERYKAFDKSFEKELATAGDPKTAINNMILRFNLKEQDAVDMSAWLFDRGYY